VSWAPQRASLPFAQFPAHDSFRGPAATVDLASDPDARRFRTVLRDGARAGPDFAGAFTVVTWGCGTECRQLAIVSARTGAVVFAGFALEADIHYRRASRLLVVDPRQCNYTEQELPGPAWRRFYEWNGRKLQLVDSVLVSPRSAC
jgi:hypothetical protein